MVGEGEGKAEVRARRNQYGLNDLRNFEETIHQQESHLHFEHRMKPFYGHSFPVTSLGIAPSHSYLSESSLSKTCFKSFFVYFHMLLQKKNRFVTNEQICF